MNAGEVGGVMVVGVVVNAGEIEGVMVVGGGGGGGR